MTKIEIGKLYRVNDRGNFEHGNIIRIKEALTIYGTPGFRYETVKGKQPRMNTFESGSFFNLSLVPVKEMIVIYRKDNKVVAVNKVTGEEGVARCAPDDTFNFETGAKLAFKRLVGEDTAAEPVKPEEPKFKVGEFVRVVGAKGGYVNKIHGFPIGQIVRVVGPYGVNYTCEGVVIWPGRCEIGTQIVKHEHIEKLEEA